TYEESKLGRLEEQLAEIDTDLSNLRDELKELRELRDLWKKAPLDELTKKYAQQLGGRRVDEALRSRQLAVLEQNVAFRELIEKQYQEDRDATAKDKGTLNVEAASEQRRMTDLKAKLDHLLAECDLLFIPRMTLRNVNTGDRIPNRLYHLDDTQ